MRVVPGIGIAGGIDIFPALKDGVFRPKLIQRNPGCITQSWKRRSTLL